ncbi:MAG TPA: amidohydrolase family protein [Candidatus Binataceae bacterium]|jgi:predicted amidohydrolase YtcJ|nr:amidohydrolase family protein [Candidatus Binataceae bacterium]
MAQDKADLVLHEGAILGHPASDSLAVVGGKIHSHGPFGELKSLVGPRTHLIRLGGRTLAPGLIDSHLHFLEGASAAAGLGLWRCRTLGELFAELRVAAGRTPPGNWLRAFGCDEALLAERRGPTRAELDQAVPKNPLRLRHQTLHASWLNSRAIAALGLEGPDFKPPEGAVVMRDASGRLTGLVVGMESWLTRRLPRVTAAETEARARLFSRELAAAGVTAFTDATVRNGPEEVALMARLVGAHAVVQRVAMMLGAPNLGAIEDARRAAAPAGISIPAVKFIESAGVDYRAIARWVARARQSGLDSAFHCTEVEELEVALQALETAARGMPPAGDGTPLFRIEHGGVITPDQLDRLRALGAWVVTNPGFSYYRGAKYVTEPGLIPYLYRLRSLIEAGLEVAGATDAPVTPARPLAAIAAAATRISIEGYEIGLSERVAIEQGLTLFTSRAARLARLEAGEIAPGRLADLIVLPRNPTGLKPAELINLPVDITIVAGRVVFERGRPEVAASPGADLFS